jgi:hypothetical protein
MDASPITVDVLTCGRQKLLDRMAEQVLQHPARVRVRLSPDIARIPALPLARRHRQFRQVRIAVTFGQLPRGPPELRLKCLESLPVPLSDQDTQQRRPAGLAPLTKLLALASLPGGPRSRLTRRILAQQHANRDIQRPR